MYLANKPQDTADCEHFEITTIYGSLCQPLQFHGHNFTEVRTPNKGSFVDMSTKLHTLAVTWRLFSPVREKQIKTA
jgi:calcineurin-like phosphoesterase family protein